MATTSGSSSDAGTRAVGPLQAAHGDGVAGRGAPRPPRRARPTGCGRSRSGRPRGPRRWSDRRRCGRRGASVAAASRSAWMPSSSARHGRPPTSPMRAPGAFSPVSRRTTVTSPLARSRGPTSTRTGMPLSSQSVARRPNEVSVRSSSRDPHARRRRARRRSARAALDDAVLVPDDQDDDLDRAPAAAAPAARRRRRGT